MYDVLYIILHEKMYKDHTYGLKFSFKEYLHSLFIDLCIKSLYIAFVEMLNIDQNIKCKL